MVVAMTMLAVAACSGAPSSVPELADAIAPHEEAIERFSMWAVRASGPSTARDRERFEETLFAPVRGDTRFAVVVVDRAGNAPLHLTQPADAEVPELSFREVRCRRLGLVDAARDPAEPADVWVRVRAGGEADLMITLRLAAPED